MARATAYSIFNCGFNNRNIKHKELLQKHPTSEKMCSDTRLEDKSTSLVRAAIRHVPERRADTGEEILYRISLHRFTHLILTQSFESLMQFI